MSQSIDFKMSTLAAPLQESVMLRGSIRKDLQQQSQTPPDHQRRRRRNLEDVDVVPTPEYKNPLYVDKDAAERPFDPESFFKGSDTFQERPTNISYFPNQVIQLSFVVSVMTPLQSPNTISKRQDPATTNIENIVLTNSLYLDDLKEALDVLATELAPKAYPDLWVRELTTSIDGWFSTGTCTLDSSGGFL
jgi:hypothetical protein